MQVFVCMLFVSTYLLFVDMYACINILLVCQLFMDGLLPTWTACLNVEIPSLAAGGCKNFCSLPHQPHYDLAASDGKNIFANIIANNRQGIFWSNESLKKDMSTLSPQEEDYLYQNSDLLASFEVQGLCMPMYVKILHDELCFVWVRHIIFVGNIFLLSILLCVLDCMLIRS